MSNSSEFSGVSGRIPDSGVAASEAERSEDDITSYLKRSANDVLGRRWSFWEDRRLTAV